jgi:beta-glucosidase
MNGRPLAIEWEHENLDAILEAWHPGVQGGNAVADVLFGDQNPSARLTTSFPRTTGQIPVNYNHKNTGRPTQSKYLDVPQTPLYPFGYGLSYTTFAYSGLQIAKAKIGLNERVNISAEIVNTGTRDGAEIVQLYVRDLVASVTRPVKELKGFEKIELKAGEKKTVKFELVPAELGFYDRSMRYVTEPGKFKVWIGPSSAEGLRRV